MAATDGDKLAARNVILSARNHYEVMSLSRTCDEAEIKKRHRELARMVHPDKLQLASEAENLKTQQAFRAVQVAYETLSEPHKRKCYDLSLTASSNGPRFVPGESNGEDSGEEEDMGPSIGQVFFMLIQIILAVAVYLGNEVVQDVLNFFSARALVLQCLSVTWVLAVYGVGFGFFYTWAVCTAVYAVHALVGIRKLFVYIAMALILQVRHWNDRNGVPFWWGLWVAICIKAYFDTSWLGAAGAGLMSTSTLFISIFMPQWTFGENAFLAAFVFSSLGAFVLRLDVYTALFIGNLSWHFLQGLPSLSLALMGLVLVYIVFVISPSLCIWVLALLTLFVGTNYMELLVLTSAATFILAVMSWGWYGAIVLALVTAGVRRTIMGEAGGKRMVLSFGLIWCLECGWISGTVCVLFIAFLGEVLKVAQEMPAPGEEGAQDSRSKKHKADEKEASPGAGHNKKKDKHKKK